VNYRKLLPAAAAAVALAAVVPAAQARHGSDDPVGHHRHASHVAHVARHGADDPANHDANDDRRVGERRHHHRHRHGDR
jgi:hypothetical protein